MFRRLRAAALLAVGCLGLAGGSTHAQYYGYGGYGWGGWGGGQTVLGSQAMGMGALAQGMGQYNLQSAQAASINADTIGRWNEYMYESQQIRNEKYYRLMEQRKAKINTGQASIRKRLAEDPTDSDITRGDALNVILDQLTAPKVYKTSVRYAKSHLGPKMIRGIPFNYASEAVTIALSEMTSDKDWPLLLRSKQFDKERNAYATAIKAAVNEDDERDLSPETIKKVENAIRALWAKVKAVPAGTPGRDEAVRHVKAMGAITKMLQSPALEEILAGVDKYDGATSGDLLAFMHTFNLRFGVAKTVEQQALYRNLYLALDTERDQILEQVGYAAAAAPDKLDPNALHPGEVFKDFDLDKAHNPSPTPPKPQ
jgi:hypothetical protein